MMAFKVFVLLMGLIALTQAEDAPVLGGVSELSGDSRKEALALLDTTLAKLATGDGPSYKPVKVTSVTGQVVSGSLNTYEVELTNGDEPSKACTVKIWTQSWLKENGTNIKIKCAGDDKELDQTW
ncbi:cystatin-like protein [Drosophila tropicalis]|uniref:cystatin-like protein n=1 Tax=Drosophila tropicalis TaxID=46794 RepID=UPI0035ABD909